MIRIIIALIVKICMDKPFGQVGTPSFLQEEFALTTEKILEQLKSL